MTLKLDQTGKSYNLRQVCGVLVVYIRHLKIAVYGKRLTSDSLFAVKTKPMFYGKMFYLHDLLK